MNAERFQNQRDFRDNFGNINKQQIQQTNEQLTHRHAHTFIVMCFRCICQANFM